MTSITFRPQGEPRVSLVMVVYGKHDLAAATLRSLAETADLPIEVVVVDNASPDGAGARLAEEVTGSRVLLWPVNLGYGTAVNLGARHARAPYLGILNSDLLFQDAWLGELVAALEEDPWAAAAVPLYLDDDGGVADAGGLVAADGRGYGYGDRLDATAPELQFPRRVDFGTAAALVVRREAFDRVGGFDAEYGLGYYEDTDLGFSLREVGLHTLYVPTARTPPRGGILRFETARQVGCAEPASLRAPTRSGTTRAAAAQPTALRSSPRADRSRLVGR